MGVRFWSAHQTGGRAVGWLDSPDGGCSRSCARLHEGTRPRLLRVRFRRRLPLYRKRYRDLASRRHRRLAFSRFGHVRARVSEPIPITFSCSRRSRRAPRHRDDIMEVDLEWKRRGPTVVARVSGNASFIAGNLQGRGRTFDVGGLHTHSPAAFQFTVSQGGGAPCGRCITTPPSLAPAQTRRGSSKGFLGETRHAGHRIPSARQIRWRNARRTSRRGLDGAATADVTCGHRFTSGRFSVPITPDVFNALAAVSSHSAGGRRQLLTREKRARKPTRSTWKCSTVSGNLLGGWQSLPALGSSRVPRGAWSGSSALRPKGALHRAPNTCSNA